MKRIIKKSLFVFISLNLLFQSVYPPIALAKQLDTPELDATVTSSPTPEPTATPTPSEALTPTPTSELPPSPSIESTPEPQEPTPVPTPDPAASFPWTFTDLTLDFVYSAPQNDKVKITFTKLPENSGNLLIKEVKLTPEQVISLGAASDTAYDITSDMENGSFQYDLELPIPKSEDNLDVEYSESPDELNETTQITQEKKITEDTITIKGLDHFTVFIITIDDGDPGFSAPGWSTHGTGYLGDHHWTTKTQDGKVATWTFTGNPGIYTISLGWTVWTDHATNAHYYLKGSLIATADQKKMADGVLAPNGTFSGWFQAGNHYLNVGDIITLPVEVGITNGNLSADAVKFDFIQPTMIWVDDGYSDVGANDGHRFGYDAFDNILSAIDTIAPSGVINVAAGAYQGNINIPLGLSGVEIKGQTGAVLTGTFSNSNNSDITITGFDIRGDGVYEGAILSDLTNSIISDNVFTNQYSSIINLSGDFSGTEIKYNDFYLTSEDVNHLQNYLSSSPLPPSFSFNYWGTGISPSPIIENFPGAPLVETNPWLVAPKDKGKPSTSGYHYVSDDKYISITGNGIATIYVGQYPTDAPPSGGLGSGIYAIGSYYDVVSENGSVTWPLHIQIKYDPVSLPSGIVETELKGIYYYNSGWHLYSKTGVNIAENYVWADVDHLTPMVIGAEQDTTAPAKPSGIRIYKGHVSDPSRQIPEDGYTNDTKIRIEWIANTEPDIDYYWFGTKSNAHHKKVYGIYYDGNISPGNNPYYYKVSAVDKSGNESLVATSYQITLDTASPIKPTGLKRITPNGLVEYQCGADVQRQTLIPVWGDVSSNDPSFDHYEYVSFKPNGSIGTEKILYVNRFDHNWVPTEDGLNGFVVRSVDKAGNTSEWALSGKSLVGSCQITYDSTAPRLDSKSPFSGWYTTSQTSTFAYYDLNGIASGGNVSCEITNEGENQTCTVTPNVCDQAGNCNTTPVTSNPANIDLTDPVSVIDTPENGGTGTITYSNSWDGEIAGTATDNLSGVANVDLVIKRSSDGKYWNGNSWEDISVSNPEPRVRANGINNWNYTLTVVSETSYDIVSHATDIAGNVENSYKLTVVYDKTIPEVNITVDPADPDSGNGWYKTQPEITLDATDDNKDKVEYQWDGEVIGKWQEYSAPFKPESEGAHTLYYRAIDKAGNESVAGIKNLRWDETDLSKGPQNMNISPNPTSGTDALVKWEHAEDAVGIDHYEVRWQLVGGSVSYTTGVDSHTFKYTIDRLTEGKWEVTVDALDGAGNRQGVYQTLIVDRIAPTPPTLTLVGTGSGTATLSWDEVDDATDYIVWYGTLPGERLFGTRTGDTTSFTVRGLGAGSYYFIIKSVDAAQNQSSESNEVNTGAITGTPGVEPGQPAQGFTPEVQGANTDVVISPTATQEVTPAVLGESTQRNWFGWQWLFVLLPLPFIFFFFGRKHRP